MGSVFESWGQSGKKKKSQSVFDSWAGSTKKKASGSAFESWVTAPPQAKTAESVAALESQVAESGAPAPAQDSPGLFRRVVDVISRPNYAVAGAAEELFTQRGGGAGAAIKRAGTELFSGIGGLKGQKEGFAQVMEQSGVSKMGSLSDLAPMLYSETGEGLPLQKDGLLDVTGRGVLGFIGDVALDPLTYINPAKTIAAIPGAKALGSATAATLKSIPAYDKALDAVGGVFNRDWKIRNLPGAIKLKQAHLNRQNYEMSVLHKSLGNSKVASIHKRDWAPFVDAVDQGTWAEKYADRPEMLAAAEEFAAFNKMFAAKEVQHGLLNPKDIRENYAAHFYDNSPSELNKILSLWAPGKKVDAATLGRHAELRAFDTLEQAENWSKAQHALDPSVPILKPVRDPLEILRRRGEASIEAIEWQKYTNEIVTAFGRKDMPFNIDDFFDLTKATPVPPNEAAKIERALSRPAAKADVAVAPRAREIPTSNYVRPLSDHADSLYRDTNFDSAMNFISENRSSADMLSEVHMATTPDLALGQGRNTGVLIELDPSGLKGQLTQKPGWQARYVENQAEVVGKFNPQEQYQKAVRSITFTPGAKSSQGARERFRSVTLPAMLKSGWTKIDLPGGGFRLERPSARLVASVDSGAKKAIFQSLSPAGKSEFLRQRLLQAKEPSEVTGVLNKYGADNAPKQKRLVGTLAEDGTPYKTFNLGKEKVELPQSMFDDLAEMSQRVLNSRELDHLLRWYDGANNVFKSFVTVMFPAFHFRNAYSNVAQGTADVGLAMLNPARHYDAVASLRSAAGDLVTKAGERIPYKQISQEMAENGVTTTGRRLAEYTGKQGVERLSTVAGKVRAAPRAFGAAIENEARATLYTVYRRRGLSAADAAERVNTFLFDYTNLSKVEQDYFRRAIPFYTWTRKNIERQFRNLATKPGLTAAELKPFRGREDENDMLTSWDAEALKVRLNRDGKTLRVLSGVDLPIRGLDFVWNGNLSGTLRQGIGMLSPILKAPLEIGFGVSAFTGKEMNRQTSNTVGRVIEELNPPDAVKQWMGYAKEFDKAGRPKYTFDGERFYILFQSWALSRLVSTSDRQFRTFTESPEWSRVMLDMLTGLRDKELNLDEEQAKRLAERERQLNESLVRWGQKREFRRVYTPKGQK